MKLNLRKIKEDNVLRISVGISLLSLIAFTAIIIVFQGGLPPYIPLANNMPWGTERLLEKNALYFLPPVAALVTVINMIILGRLYDKNILMARIMSFNTLLFNVLALLALVQILILVL